MRAKIFSVFTVVYQYKMTFIEAIGTQKKRKIYERDNRRQLPSMWQLVHTARITYGR